MAGAPRTRSTWCCRRCPATDSRPRRRWSGGDPGRTARVWAALMHRLGYTRYVAQGGDVGAGVCDAMAIQAPDGLAGIHLNFLRRPPPEVVAVLLGRAPVPAGLTDAERAALAAFGAQARKGYNAEQSQAPQ